MTLLIIFGTLSAAYAVYFCGTPTRSAERVATPSLAIQSQKDLREKTIAFLGPVLLLAFWAKSSLDLVRAAACGHGETSGDSVSTAPPPQICFGKTPGTRHLVAWTLILTAAFIRRACYRELGKFFTFTPSIQEGHKLICTGPYAVVRHPAYGAWIILTIGVVMLHIEFEGVSRVLRRPLPSFDVVEGWYNLLYISLWTVSSYLLLTRAKDEDEMLRKETGSEWIRYAREVPYQLIPYVL